MESIYKVDINIFESLLISVTVKIAVVEYRFKKKKRTFDRGGIMTRGRVRETKRLSRVSKYLEELGRTLPKILKI